MHRPLYTIFVITVAWLVSLGCTTTSGQLLDAKLQLLEAQFSKLEKHSVPRGPAAHVEVPDPDAPPPLPVVKLHKLKSPSNWGGDAQREPEVRVAGGLAAPEPSYAPVQRAARGATGLDARGNLVNSDGRVIYRAGTGSPERAASAKAAVPKRVWEDPPTPKTHHAGKGIKPMPRLKQFRIGGGREVPSDRGDHIRVESAPPAPPIPVLPPAEPQPSEPAVPERSVRKKTRVVKPRWSRPAPKTRGSRARSSKPKPDVTPVPAPLTPQKAHKPALRVVKAPVASPKPMPVLRRKAPAPKVTKTTRKLVIRRAPGPQRLTKQRSYKGKRERTVKRLYARAMKEFRAGDDLAAGRAFKKILREHYTHELADNALYWLGETTYRQGQWLQALSYFQDIVIRYPDGNKVGDAMVKSALCYAHLGDTSYAQKVLADVESLFPSTRLSEVARERRLALGPGDSG